MTKSTGGTGRGGARVPGPGKKMGRPTKPDPDRESLRVTVSATLTRVETAELDALRGKRPRSEVVREAIRQWVQARERDGVERQTAGTKGDGER